MSSLETVFLHLAEFIEEAAEKTLIDAGKRGEDAARNTTLFRNRGPLRDATNFHPTSALTGFVLADKAYATFLEDGNPYDGFVITPVRAKVLHFKIDGKDIFVKSVKAHGPLPFMKIAQLTVANSIEQIFCDNIDKLMR